MDKFRVFEFVEAELVLGGIINKSGRNNKKSGGSFPQIVNRVQDFLLIPSDWRSSSIDLVSCGFIPASAAIFS